MKHFFAYRILGVILFGILLIIISGFYEKHDKRSKHLQFNVRTDVAHQELSTQFCWFHPRAAAIPGFGMNGNPAVIMTIQKHLVVSDYYSGMYYMRTDDLGKTWTEPVEIPELAWQYEPDGTTVSVADVTPGWHEKTGKLLAIGIKVRYNKQGEALFDTPRSRDAAYTVFDPKTSTWSTWKMIANVPDPDSKFYFVQPGCVQWLVKPDGKVLVPVHFSSPNHIQNVTVFECTFDGTSLSYIRHGDEITLATSSPPCLKPTRDCALVEPSLVLFKGTYYLTIRNEYKAYVATSHDCFSWKPIKPWLFDDGQELGSYNTQAHWLVHDDGLFLSYTRRGANNDHITRNRAPIFMAQVDPVKLNIIRSTEQILIPERGVMLGNFGAAPITKDESWVTDAEYIVGDKPHPRGANGTVWVARVLRSKN
jgi:hypothetical protein